MRLQIIFLVLGTVLSCGSLVLAQDEIKRKDVGFTIALGYVQGRDYPQAIKEYWQTKGYEVVKTGFFLNLESGVEFLVMYDLYLNPRIGFMVNWLERRAAEMYVPEKGNLELNMVIMPGVSVKYFLPSIGHHFFYVDGFMSGILPFSGQVDLSLSSEKYALGYGAGYQYVSHGNGWGIEIGSSSIPVKVPGVYEANFGGVEITLTCFFTTREIKNE